jgi:hypothetical protein
MSGERVQFRIVRLRGEVRIDGPGLRGECLGHRVRSAGFMMCSIGFRIKRCRVEGLGLRVWVGVSG